MILIGIEDYELRSKGGKQSVVNCLRSVDRDEDKSI